MAGHRGAEGHRGGVRVADLTDQDDVRVLPHEAPHAVREVELDRFVHRGLADPGHRILDRVLEGHDVDSLVVEVSEDRVEGGGLSAARRPGHQDHALGAFHHPAERSERVGGHAELAEGHDPSAAVEHPQDDVLAVRGREGGHPVVDVVAGDGEGHAPVLGGARLRDVHAAHHLEAHRDGGPVAAVQASHLAQDAVDPVANPQEPRLRLEVDVGGSSLHRVGEEHVDEADNRLAVLVGGPRYRPRIELPGLDLAQDPGHGEVVAVGAFQEPLDVRAPREEGDDLHPVADEGTEVIERDHVEGIRHRDGEPPGGAVRRVLQGEADGHEAPRDGLRDRLHRLGLDHRAPKIHALHSEGPADGVANDGLGDEPEPGEDVGEPAAGPRLLGERNPGLVLGDRAGLEEQGPERVEVRGFTEGRGGGSPRGGRARRHGSIPARPSRAAIRSRAARTSNAGGASAARSSASR